MKMDLFYSFAFLTKKDFVIPEAITVFGFFVFSDKLLPYFFIILPCHDVRIHLCMWCLDLYDRGTHCGQTQTRTDPLNSRGAHVVWKNHRPKGGC